MTIATRIDDEGFLENLKSRLQHWWQEHQEISRTMREITANGQQDLMAIAKDCGLTADQLVGLVKSGPHGADEMQFLMKALNIDPDTVRCEEPQLYRSMILNCALCPDKSECQHDLSQGSAPQHYVHYCLNEASMNDLRARPEFQMD